MYYSYGICSFAFGKGKGCGRRNVHTHRAHRPPEERGQNAHTLEPGTGTVPRRSKEPHAGDSVPDRDGGHQTQGGHQPGEGNPGAAHRKQQGHEANGSGREAGRLVQRQPEMAPGNIRGAEPCVGSPAHGREDTSHTRHYRTDSDRRAQKSQKGRTEREKEIPQEEHAGCTAVC